MKEIEVRALDFSAADRGVAPPRNQRQWPRAVFFFGSAARLVQRIGESINLRDRSLVSLDRRKADRRSLSLPWSIQSHGSRRAGIRR
jgi:hypothetical protein